MQFPLTRNSRWNIRIFFQKTFFFQNVKSHIPSRILKPVVSIRYRNSWNKLNPNLKWVLNLVPKESHAAKSLQSCPTLCDPTDGSPPGPPVPGILQARTLEWVAISFCHLLIFQSEFCSFYCKSTVGIQCNFSDQHIFEVKHVVILVFLGTNV